MSNFTFRGSWEIVRQVRKGGLRKDCVLFISQLFSHTSIGFTGGGDTMFSFAQSTWGKKLLTAAGVDPNELKME